MGQEGRSGCRQSDRDTTLYIQLAAKEKAKPVRQRTFVASKPGEQLLDGLNLCHVCLQSLVLLLSYLLLYLPELTVAALAQLAVVLLGLQLTEVSLAFDLRLYSVVMVRHQTGTGRSL